MGQNVAERAGVKVDSRKGYQANSGEYFSSAQAAKNSNVKDGTASYVMGRSDPGIEGYNGKTWVGSPEGHDRADLGGGGGSMGVSAFDVGGQKESTRGMGNTTTQTERGYDNRTPIAGAGDGFSVSQVTPIQHGDLATGGEYSAASFGMDPQKLMIIGSMLGVTKGPKGTTIGPNGTYGDGKFQASDVLNWAQQHPWLWKIGKTLGNLIIPGAATIGDAALRYGVNHGIGDGVPDNASIHRVNR